LDLQALHKRHRQQLPIYADIFQKWQRLRPRNRPARKSAPWLTNSKTRYHLCHNNCHPDRPVGHQTQSGTTGQRLEKQFVKDNKDYRKEWKFDADSADQLEVQTDKGIENAERLYGRLDSKQKALVKQLAKESQFDLSKSWNERLRRQQYRSTTLERITKSQQGLSFAQQESLALLERSVLHSPDEVLPKLYRHAPNDQLRSCGTAA
jgi:hypothetical protein